MPEAWAHRVLQDAHGPGSRHAAGSRRGTWMRRLWQMLHIFTASGYVSRMCCSISRMARVCKVNSPSFCGDTAGVAISQVLSC